jgi:hypothetical protein
MGMKPEVRQEATELLEEGILFGFENQDELFESIRDVFYDEKDFDEEWLRQAINDRYNRYQREGAQWEKPTGFDRLAIAFDQLTEQRIVALHKAGHTKSDGVEDCMEVINELSKNDVSIKGYCYYHSQDLARAVDPGIKNLFIGFDSVDHNDAAAIAVANTIIDILQRNGIKVAWPGTVEQRIEILNIDWKKMPDDQEWGGQRVIQLLTKKRKIKKPFWKFW